MEKTIQQKLNEIKSINEKIADVELASNKLSLNNEINWDLLPEEAREDVRRIVRHAYDEAKAGLLDKASNLMK